MRLVVQITNVATGQTRDYGSTVEPDWVENLPYLWSEGNYGCDCNRELFWHRAENEAEPDDLVCGDNERFTIGAATLDGKPFDLAY